MVQRHVLPSEGSSLVQWCSQPTADSLRPCVWKPWVRWEQRLTHLMVLSRSPSGPPGFCSQAKTHGNSDFTLLVSSLGALCPENLFYRILILCYSQSCALRLNKEGNIFENNMYSDSWALGSMTIQQIFNCVIQIFHLSLVIFSLFD